MLVCDGGGYDIKKIGCNNRVAVEKVFYYEDKIKSEIRNNVPEKKVHYFFSTF